MVLLLTKEGRLANRLWQAAHFISNSIEYDYKLLHYGFKEYAGLFSESLKQANKDGNYKIVTSESSYYIGSILLKYRLLSKKVGRWLNIKLPFIKEISFFEYSSKKFNIADPTFLRLCAKRIVFVDGWFFKDKNAIVKHAEIIREIFQPDKIFRNSIEQLKYRHFVQYDYVIGVHIRRGDYKTYKNGMWFYDHKDYKNFMQRILALDMFRNRKTAFLLCSDEEFDLTQYEPFNIIIPTGHIIEDLYALAECDFLIGPPSTYSAWASFYGNVPILHVTDKNLEIQETSFRIVDYGYC